MDYGNRARVALGVLREMPCRFLELPFQVRGHTPGAEPASPCALLQLHELTNTRAPHAALGKRPSCVSAPALPFPHPSLPGPSKLQSTDLPPRVFPSRPCTGSGEESHPQPQRTHPMGTASRMDMPMWAATAMEQNSPSTRRGWGAPDPSARWKRRGHTKGGDARLGPTPG